MDLNSIGILFGIVSSIFVFFAAFKKYIGTRKTNKKKKELRKKAIEILDLLQGFKFGQISEGLNRYVKENEYDFEQSGLQELFCKQLRLFDRKNLARGNYFLVVYNIMDYEKTKKVYKMGFTTNILNCNYFFLVFCVIILLV